MTEELKDLPQFNRPGTVSSSTSLRSQVKNEESGERPLPIPPPRPHLRPEHGDHEARQSDRFTMARPSPTGPGERRSRGRFSVAQSVLTNPWDGDETPGSAGIERVIFQLPSFPPTSALPTSSFKIGLPPRPRAPSALPSPEIKPSEITRSSLRESGVEQVRPRPAPI
jgi:hypothetical protein